MIAELNPLYGQTGNNLIVSFRDCMVGFGAVHVPSCGLKVDGGGERGKLGIHGAHFSPPSVLR